MFRTSWNYRRLYGNHSMELRWGRQQSLMKSNTGVLWRLVWLSTVLQGVCFHVAGVKGVKPMPRPCFPFHAHLVGAIFLFLFLYYEKGPCWYNSFAKILFQPFYQDMQTPCTKFISCVLRVCTLLYSTICKWYLTQLVLKADNEDCVHRLVSNFYKLVWEMQIGGIWCTKTMRCTKDEAGPVIRVERNVPGIQGPCAPHVLHVLNVWTQKHGRRHFVTFRRIKITSEWRIKHFFIQIFCVDVPWLIPHIVHVKDSSWGCSSFYNTQLCHKNSGRIALTEWRRLAPSRHFSCGHTIFGQQKSF